ncbi:MAG: hypothetical protein HUJ70_04075, partial [Pseudobutyrivibrio sp.]|nr:hypothetical protein [Pseudobutyrivibrio sp.]
MQISSNGLNQYHNLPTSLEAASNSKIATTGSTTTIGDLQAGTVFEGTISSVDKGKVTINLSNGQSMSARLDTGVSGIVEGQSLFFEVKSNEGGTVQIRPVSNGLTGNPTLLNALNTAGISVNERTLTMVDSMMSQQLPIDSDSLLAMNRSLLNNPDISPETLVLMNRLDIPVTTANANMFEAYASNQARISEDINNLVSGLTDAVSDNAVSPEKTLMLNNNIVQALFSEEKVTETAENSQVTGTAETAQIPFGKEGAELKMASSDPSVVTDNLSADNNEQANQLNRNSQNPAPEIKVSSEQISGPKISDLPVSVEEESTTSSPEILIKEDTELSLEKLFTSNDKTRLENLTENLKELPQLKEALFDEKGQLKAELAPREVVRLISELSKEMPQGASYDNLQRLLTSEPYKKLLGQAIKDELSMNPKDIVKPGEVSKFFEKVMDKTDRLSSVILKDTVRDTDQLMQSVSNIRENITFMNDANQLYSFVQIPLKMYNQTTESKLYVM